MNFVSDDKTTLTSFFKFTTDLKYADGNSNYVTEEGLREFGGKRQFKKQFER